MSRLQRISAWWQHAFAVEDPREKPEPQERELAERLARLVVQRRLTAPATMLLEMGRPLHFLGSQVLVFLAPFASAIFSPGEYERFVRLLEKRRGIDLLLEALLTAERSQATGGDPQIAPREERSQAEGGRPSDPPPSADSRAASDGRE